jgi:flagellar hook protein FlgE
MFSFYTTLSGLQACTKQLSVISNNIANSETVAYKSSGISFEEVLDTSLSATNTGSTGIGVKVQNIVNAWTQGTLTETGSDTDLAISGSGFFVLKDENGSTYYSRDGEFEYTGDNVFVNADGLKVQGYAIDDDGSLGALSDISIPNILAASATSEINTTINLDSTTETGDSFSSTINVYDSMGNEIALTIEFTKTANNEWSWTASIPSDVGTATGSGVLSFNTNGDLEPGTDPTITFALTNGSTTSQTITWDIYGNDDNTNGDLTQYNATSVLSDQSQDGTTVGKLASASISSTGIVTALYSNGESKDLFQIALATFSNNDGLEEMGSSLYKETNASGSANIGAAGSEQFGTLTSGSLESSNVDLATEMSNLIIAQRAYQSCAKVFTALDELMQTTINMKQ